MASHYPHFCPLEAQLLYNWTIITLQITHRGSHAQYIYICWLLLSNSTYWPPFMRTILARKVCYFPSKWDEKDHLKNRFEAIQRKLRSLAVIYRNLNLKRLLDFLPGEIISSRAPPCYENLLPRFCIKSFVIFYFWCSHTAGFADWTNYFLWPFFGWCIVNNAT